MYVEKKRSAMTTNNSTFVATIDSLKKLSDYAVTCNIHLKDSGSAGHTHIWCNQIWRTH